jgi:mRNA interferase MazF
MEKDFNRWSGKKKILQNSEFIDYAQEREVWWCSLGINVGSEQDGRGLEYERPVLILKKFNREMVLIIPLSTKIRESPYHVTFLHGDDRYVALISQLRLISTKRLLRRAYKMDEIPFESIRKATKEML